MDGKRPTVSLQLPFEKNCGQDHLCEGDLNVHLSFSGWVLSPPTSRHSSFWVSCQQDEKCLCSPLAVFITEMIGMLSANSSWASRVLPLPLIQFQTLSNGISLELYFLLQPAGPGGGKLSRTQRDSGCVEWGWGFLQNCDQLLLPSRAVLSTSIRNSGK